MKFRTSGAYHSPARNDRVVKRSDRIQPRLLKVCVGRTSHRRELVRASATTRHGKKAKSTENAKRPVASSGMVRDRCGSNSGRNCVEVELSFCRCVWSRQVQTFHEIQEFSNERKKLHEKAKQQKP